MPGVASVDRAGGVDAVFPRQPDVHQHDVWGVLVAQRHGLVTAACCADDDEPAVAFEDRLNQRCEALVVFGEQDS